MEKIIINNDNTIIELLKENDSQKIDSALLNFSENYLGLYNVLKSLINKGFITTSCSKGHDNNEWKDSLYVAFYIDNHNVNKILNFIYYFNNMLDEYELNLVHYTFNYSVNKDNDINIEYMFGLQIDLYEDSTNKEAILNKIINVMDNDLSTNIININYNFIYIINRFVNFQKLNTSWINIAVDANNIENKFALIYKKNANDNFVINKVYSYSDGLDEFEYLLNY